MPEQAVVDTGAKKIVYVERKEGLFEGVEVELGPRQDDFYPVLKGLAAGDRVAAAGGFLVDAETRLNPAAASTYFGASGGPQSGSAFDRRRSRRSRRRQGHGRPKPRDCRSFRQKTSRTSNNCRKKIGSRPRPRRYVP